MTADSARRWAAGCNVTYKCLQGYEITGLKEFICKNGIWIDKKGNPDEKLPECKNELSTFRKFHKAFYSY